MSRVLHGMSRGGAGHACAHEQLPLYCAHCPSTFVNRNDIHSTAGVYGAEAWNVEGEEGAVSSASSPAMVMLVERSLSTVECPSPTSLHVGAAAEANRYEGCAAKARALAQG